MRVNVEKVLERDSKLSELDNRAGNLLFYRLYSSLELCTNGIFILDALQMGASQFESQAGKLKKKMFWKNMKVSIVK